ncbi:MAG: FHA domain-containing protein [Chloroflexi bacterium]|nr:MAG: FHA domain-containing protein [Chloroflexota bacterium]
MTKIEGAIVIDRPVEEVWAFFAAIDNISTWFPRTVSVMAPQDGSLENGTVVALRRRFGPIEVGSEQRITACEPPRVIEFQASGGLLEGSGRTRLELASLGATTRVTVSADARGLFGVLAGLAGPERDAQLLADIRGLVEAQLRPASRPSVEPALSEPATAAAPTTEAVAATPAVENPTITATELPSSDLGEVVAEIPATSPPPTNGSVGADQHQTLAATGAGLILQLQSEDGPAAAFEVTKTGATLGRGEENSIRLNDLSVSRRHARISYRQGGYWISDLGSTSGTWVDGTRLNAAGRLAAGQMIDVGVCRLTVALASDAAARQTTGASAHPGVPGRRRRSLKSPS